MSTLAGDLGAFWATALREWRVMRRYPSIFLGMIFWPLILPGVYLLQAQGFGANDPRSLQAFASRTGTAEVAGFMYVGGAVYMWLSLILWGPGTSLRKEQLTGSLEQLFLTPASRLAFLFGPTPAYLVQTIWLFFVIFVVLKFAFGAPLEPLATLRALAVIAIATPALFAMGALFSAAVLRFREVGGAIQAVRGLFQVFCGMTFPIVVLPEWARAFALALPPTYVLADIRATLLAGATLVEILPDLTILVALAALLSVLAVAVMRRAEWHGRLTGSLGQY